MDTPFVHDNKTDLPLRARDVRNRSETNDFVLYFTRKNRTKLTIQPKSL